MAGDAGVVALRGRSRASEGAMGVAISIRLDDDVREELEAQARGVGLATLVRELTTAAAREARRARIREASAEVGRRVGASAEGRAFYEGWGTPRGDDG